MKKVYRQLLLFASSIVFLALAPIILLYAIGYRTTFPVIDPVPIGVALVETVPTRADIAVNGKSLGHTPRAVNNLSVGSFRLEITKEGYTSWAKTLHVRPGLATEVRDVRLFPATLASQTLWQNVEKFTLAPNRQIVAFLHAARRLSFIDDQGKILRPEQTIPWPPASMLWSPNSTEVLLRNSHGTFGLASVDRRYPFAPVAVPATALEAVWHPRSPQHLLVLTAAGALVDYDLATAQSQLLHTNIKVFAASARDIYAVTDTNQLIRLSFQGRSLSLPFTPPEVELVRLTVTPEGHVALTTSSSTYVYTNDTGLADTGLRANIVGWSPDGNMLYLAPDQYSLHVYNAADASAILSLGQTHLIIRLSRPISHIQWFAGSRHLIYQVEDEITITEIDTRDHPISHTPDTTNTGDAQIAVGLDGELLFYLKRESSIQHLYRASLVVP